MRRRINGRSFVTTSKRGAPWLINAGNTDGGFGNRFDQTSDSAMDTLLEAVQGESLRIVMGEYDTSTQVIRIVFLEKDRIHEISN